MEESVKNLEQEQPCGEMENAMEQEQQAPMDFLVHCKQALRLEKIDIANYSPLALAYIGDAVYELMMPHPCGQSWQYAGQQDAQKKCQSGKSPDPGGADQDPGAGADAVRARRL